MKHLTLEHYHHICNTRPPSALRSKSPTPNKFVIITTFNQGEVTDIPTLYASSVHFGLKDGLARLQFNEQNIETYIETKDIMTIKPL
jgi:hypothetical protein